VGGHGNPLARIVIVGEAPGTNEVIQARPFVGQSGQLLDAALRQVGLDRRDIYVTNALLCQLPPTGKYKVGDILACNQRLLAEIDALPNRHVLVLMGNTAVSATTDKGNISSLVTQTTWEERFGCFVLYSYHPAACFRRPDDYADVIYALARARALLAAPKSKLYVPPVSYRLESDSKHDERGFTVFDRLHWLLSKAKGRIACDIETAGEKEGDALDWRMGWVTQIGLYTEEMGKAYLLPREAFLRAPVRSLLCRIFARRDLTYVWHNGKFDVQFLKKEGIPTVRIDEDTLLLHKSLDERSGTHGLKQLSARYFGDNDYGEEKAGFTDPRYHAKDCVYTYKLVPEIDRDLSFEPASLHGYPGPRYRHDHVLAPVWNAIADIEMHGVKIDMDYLPALKESEGAKLLAQEIACQKLAGVTVQKERSVSRLEERPPRYGKKGQLLKAQPPKRVRVKELYQEPLNLRSPDQIAELFYTRWGWPVLAHTPTGKSCVNVEVLKAFLENAAFSAHHDFIRALMAYRITQKLYSTYVLGAEEASAWDGCVHTHFSFNPVTGRPSSADLNIQNIPSKSPIKKLYIARDGYWFLQADYKNQEIRAAAWYSRCQALLDACLSTLDFHTGIARGVFARIFADLDAAEGSTGLLEALLEKYSDFRQIAATHQKKPLSASELYAAMASHLRRAAKAVSFGIVYGEGPMGLQESLRRQGIVVSLEEAALYIREWLARYPELDFWLAKMRHEIHEVGFVDTPFGHRRRKPLITRETTGDAERQAMNSPIQSLSSDMTMLAVTRLHALLRERRLGHILFFVHDSIAFEIKKEHLQEATLLIRGVMEHALDGIQTADFYVPFPVDIEIGRGWGDLIGEDDWQKITSTWAGWQGWNFTQEEVFV